MIYPNNQVRIAVVGCGHIGTRHLHVITAEPRSTVVGYYDTATAACERAREIVPEAHAYGSFAELLADPNVDVVSICTPHGLHAEFSVAAAEAGKHVLVEKPMSLNHADAERMITAARVNCVRMFVVKQNRFNAPVRLVKQALELGKLGKVYLAQCNVLWNRHQEYYAQSEWRGDRQLEGGVLHTQVSHFLDLLIWWFGDVVDAKGICDRLAHDIEFEDVGVAGLKFDSGTVGSLTWTTLAYNANLEGSITLLAERGNIKIGGKYLNRIEHWDVQSYPMPEDEKFEDMPNEYGTYQGSSNNHDKMMEELVGNLLERRAGLVEGAEGMRTIDAIDRIYAGVDQDKL